MTSNRAGSERGVMLFGLDGSNPLAFLAALGTLRTLTIAWPTRSVKLSWSANAGAWRPVILADGELNQDDCVKLLDAQLKKLDGHLALSPDDNLNIEPDQFRAFARKCVQAGEQTSGPDGRIAADFAAAFACDALANKQGKIQDTALRTMSGAGHQHFLAFMRHIVMHTTLRHLTKALFQTWAYDDPVTNQTLRWDPSDDSRYALRWRDPSGDPARKTGGTVLGANRLAVEGLPVVTSVPSGTTLRTVGFTVGGRRNTFWTWPIWHPRLTLGVVSSLLALADLQDVNHPSRARLVSRGVVEVFRSQRITVGKFRNFAPATAL